MKCLIHLDGGVTFSLILESDRDWMSLEDYECQYGSLYVKMTSYYKRMGNVIYRRCFTFYTEDGAKYMTLLTNESGEFGRLVLHYESIKLRDKVDKYYRYALSRLGFKIRYERLRRVDLAIDSDVNFRQVKSLIEQNKFATRLSREKARMYDTSYTIGTTSNIEVCIYDKIQELAVSKNPWTKLRDLQYVFNEKETITRVEFRCCRLWLNRNGIATIEEFEERLYDIVRYLTRTVFCLQDDNHKRGYAFNLWTKMTAKHCQFRVKRSTILIDRICRKKDQNNLQIAHTQLKSVLKRGNLLHRSAISAANVALMLKNLCQEFRELTDYVQFTIRGRSPSSERVPAFPRDLFSFQSCVSAVQ